MPRRGSRKRRSSRLALGGLTALGGAAIWWRRNPSACPYGQRFWIEAPHPFITRPRLREALAPAPGERILEVGPGTGYYSLAVASWLAPDGTLEIFDLQPKMLEHTLRRAAQRGIDNIHASTGDAQRLPFDAGSFDGAYLTAVLGEIPDQDAALRELRRVLKPTGRLVVGELLGDPHWVSPKALRRRAQKAGLRFERQLGAGIGYFARFGRDD
jgi:ubiquinone/menaquinone biosynthesis C-methylase UbiE